MSLIFSARPLSYRLSSKLRRSGQRNAITVANERVELAPATRIDSFDAISLPNEEGRATAAMAGANLAEEQKSARRCTGVNGATVAYRYDNALVADSCWYANGHFESLRSQRRRPLLLSSSEQLGEAQLCTDAGAELFFGHWLCDAMSTQLLAADRNLPGISIAHAARLHEPGYRELFDLPARPVSVARVEKLWVIDDRGYNQQRIDRFLRLRQRVRAKVAPDNGRLVFIDRGQLGASRKLVNREAVIDALVLRGFSVISPEQMAPRDIAQALAGASLVVGVEGSHLNHALMALPPGAGLLAIQPPDRFNMFNKYMCEYASLRFGFVVADSAEGGFSLEPDRLARTIDLFGGVL